MTLPSHDAITYLSKEKHLEAIHHACMVIVDAYGKSDILDGYTYEGVSPYAFMKMAQGIANHIGSQIPDYVPDNNPTPEIPISRIEEFCSYVMGFYGPKGIYPIEGVTPELVRKATNLHIEDCKSSGYCEFEGDSVDREYVREILRSLVS